MFDHSQSLTYLGRTPQISTLNDATYISVTTTTTSTHVVHFCQCASHGGNPALQPLPK